MKLSILHILFDVLVNVARPMILKDHPEYIEAFDDATDQIGRLLFGDPAEAGVSSGAEPLAAPMTAIGSYDDLVRTYASKVPTMVNVAHWTVALGKAMAGKDPKDQREAYQQITDALNLWAKKTHGVSVDFEGRVRPGSK